MLNTIKNKFRKRLKKTKGFTIIEVVVVVIMITIATSIAMPNFGEFTDNADSETIKAELATIYTIATNLADEDEVDIEKHFENGKASDALQGEIKAITNFDDEKISRYKYGVVGDDFVVHTKDKDNNDLIWDGQNLKKNQVVELITASTSKDIFDKTGGYIPNVQDKLFTYADKHDVNGNAVSIPGNSNIVTGLTDMGRQYFADGKLIIPEFNEDNGIPIKGIAAGAFRNENLISVYIHKDVSGPNAVGLGAFQNNGSSGNTVALTDGTVNKYHNSFVGEWDAVGDKWQKKVKIVDMLIPATRDIFRNMPEVNYGDKLTHFHKGTIVARHPIAGFDQYTDSYPGFPFRPEGRPVPSEIKGSDEHIATGTINDKKYKDIDRIGANAVEDDSSGEWVVVQGRPNDVKEVKDWSSKMLNGLPTNWDNVKYDWRTDTSDTRKTQSFVGQIVGDGKFDNKPIADFEYKGTLNQDKVISGTPAGYRDVYGIPDSKPIVGVAQQSPTMHYSEGLEAGSKPNSSKPDEIYSTQYNWADEAYNSPLVFDKVINGGTPKGEYEVTRDKGGTAGSQPGSVSHSEGSNPNIYTGTLHKDKVTNGGTPADTKYVSGINNSSQPSSMSYSTGSNPNIYTGTLYKDKVISGTPADTKYVTAQTSSSYNSAGYTGSLSSYVYSGTPYDSKYVTAQTSSSYNSGGYSGTLSSYVYSGEAVKSKSVSGQTSSSYNSGGYSGTLSSYVVETTGPQISTTGNSSRTATSTQTWKWTTNTSGYWSYLGEQKLIALAQTKEYWALWNGHDWSNAQPMKLTDITARTYNSGGYKGQLGRTYLYPLTWKNFNPGAPQTAPSVMRRGSADGLFKGNPRKWIDTSTSSWVASTSRYAPSFGATLAYSWDGWTGTIGKSGGPVWQGGNGKRPTETHTYKQAYSGVVYKPGPTIKTTYYKGTVYTKDTRVWRYQGTVTRPDTRVYRYQGNVHRPDTRIYDYAGNVSKNDTRYYNYTGVVRKEDTRNWNYKGTIKKVDTRLWSYKGSVTGDSREKRYFYHYKLYIE